jgi:hypothetical protein
MITVLNLGPITKALCLAAVVVVWGALFLKLYREQTRRNAVKRAYWWHRYIRGYSASLASRRSVEPARQWDQLEAAFSSKGESTATEARQ